jgi:hypothetical protein
MYTIWLGVATWAFGVFMDRPCEEELVCVGSLSLPVMLGCPPWLNLVEFGRSDHATM